MKKLLPLLLVVLFGISVLPVYADETGENEYGCSEWAIESVAQGYQVGLLDETTAYSYQTPISREDFCELIYDLVLKTEYFENWYNEQTKDGTQPLPPFTKRPFDDTENEAVYILYNHGIVYGKSETHFAPNDELTREEAATIIIRMVNIVNPLMATEMWYEYQDIEEVSDWAIESVQVISNLGFMRGVGDNRFAPKDTYTTEQAITTVLRVYHAFEMEKKSNSMLKFIDKDDNIIITEYDVVSCDVKYEKLQENGPKEWYVEITLTSDAQETFKNATKQISGYADGDNFIAILFHDVVISVPRVMEEINADTILITGAFTEESVKELANVIDSVNQ